MRYLSVCSGIEAATVAWHPLGWEPVAFSEIERFPSAVLKHHYPTTPNLGDMNHHANWSLPAIDLLVGGTPCQSFSVAGLRQGLADPRGGLMLRFLEIAQRHRPRWVVWENVPGVLSSNGGRDFGTFLGMLAELGYGFAYRVLDAQYFGVAQRRRRVFVVANARSWQRAAAVLFESHSLQGHPTPSRETREGTAPCTRGGVELCGPLNARDYKDPGTDGMNHNSAKMVPVAYPMHGGMIGRQEQNGPSGSGFGEEPDPSYTLTAGGQVRHGVATSMQVRRLTPVECERLQGFPDDYTAIEYRKKPAADGPRYKALGNSMAVPCMRWIGERIAAAN